MSRTNPFTICLWIYNGDAEQAAKHYASIFKNSEILKIRYRPEVGMERRGQNPGTGMFLI